MVVGDEILWQELGHCVNNVEVPPRVGEEVADGNSKIWFVDIGNRE